MPSSAGSPSAAEAKSSATTGASSERPKALAKCTQISRRSPRGWAPDRQADHDGHQAQPAEADQPRPAAQPAEEQAVERRPGRGRDPGAPGVAPSVPTSVLMPVSPPGSGRRSRGRRRAGAPPTGGPGGRGRWRRRRGGGAARRSVSTTTWSGPAQEAPRRPGRRPAGRRRRPWPGRRVQGEAVGAVVHQVADGPEVALGGQPALGDDQHAGAEALDLVEHVARHDHAAPGVAEALEQVDHVEPLAGVEAGERLVEHEHVGVVDEGLRHLHPLAHALGVGWPPGGGRRGRARRCRARRGPRASGSATPWSRPARRTNSSAGWRSNRASCWGTRPMARVTADVGAGVAAEHLAPGPGTAASARTAAAAPSTCRRRSGRAAR